MVECTASVGGATLDAGAGAGVTAPDAFEFSFDRSNEMLLIHVLVDVPRGWE